jgi:hypothetical protein
MTEALRPAEDMQATSTRATAPDPSGRTRARQRHHRGGLAPVPIDSERTQAGSRRAGSP